MQQNTPQEHTPTAPAPTTTRLPTQLPTTTTTTTSNKTTLQQPCISGVPTIAWFLAFPTGFKPEARETEASLHWTGWEDAWNDHPTIKGVDIFAVPPCNH